MKGNSKKVIALLLIWIFLFSTVPSVFAAPEEGTVFLHQKTGTDVYYKVLPDGTVSLGDGTRGAVPVDTKRLTIPANVTYFEEWETVHPYGVSMICDNAFLGCNELKEIYIEGVVSFSDYAFAGLSADVHFTTASGVTKENLIHSGISPEQITYQPIQIKYLALGDSISAGFALEEYKQNDLKTIQISDGDRFPTPSDAFVKKISETMQMSGETRLDNQAVSGWTSAQLLEMLKSGAFDAALKDADIITVSIGSNDLLNPFMDIIADCIKQEFGAAPEEENLQQGADLFGVLIPTNGGFSVEELMDHIANVTVTLNDTLENNAVLNQACEDFKERIQPEILAELSKRAPGAKIYWATMYNPFYGVSLDIKELFPGLGILQIAPKALEKIEPIELGKLGAHYIEKMNQAFSVNTEGYTAIPLYDVFNQMGVTNVNLSRENGFSAGILLDDTVNFQLDPHPNKAGHQLIYDTAVPIILGLETPTKVGFTDVAKTDWFYEDVHFAVDQGWMNGVSQNAFEPNRIVSRAVLVTVLWRLAGEPQAKEMADFEDVIQGEWYEMAVAWAAEEGITNGYGNGLFGTLDSVSREQLVVFLHRYAAKFGYDLSSYGNPEDFADAEAVSDYAKAAMEWAVGKGIISGKEGKRIDPQGTATAAEIAAILRRFYESETK